MFADRPISLYRYRKMQEPEEAPVTLKVIGISKEKTSDELVPESLFKTSPTRVLDFGEEEEVKQDEDSPTSFKPRFESDVKDVKQLSTPDLARRSRQQFKVMPTLEEATCDSEDEESACSLEEASCETEQKVPDSPPLRGEKRALSDASTAAAATSVSPGKVSVKKANDKRFSAGRPKTHFDRIDELRARALASAATGREEEALETYRKARRLNAAEIEKIKFQMKQVEGKHPSTVDSIHLRLREDWLKVGISNGKIRTDMAILYERLGDHRRALASCKESLSVYQHHEQFCDLRSDGVSLSELVQEAKVTLTRMERAQASFEERKEKHEELILLRGRAAMTGDPELLKKAECLAIKLKAFEVSTLGETHPQVADTCVVLSELSLALGDSERAVGYLKEALDINERALGSQHPQTASSLLLVARWYSNNRQSDEHDTTAFEHYSRALEIFKSLAVPPSEMGSVLSEIALIHIRKHRFDEAIVSLRDALDFYHSHATKSSSKEMDTDSTCENIEVWRNLGRCYYQTKQYGKSINSLVNALDMQREIRRSHDDAVKKSQNEKVAFEKPIPYLATDEGIADTLRRLGKSYHAIGKNEKARAVLKEAILIYRLAVARTISDSRGKTDDMLPEKQDELAGTMYSYAEVLFDLGEYDQASKSFNESMQLRLFSDANKQGQRTNMVHCSMCLVGMGNVHMAKGEQELAERVFKDALDYCNAHGIPEKHPIHQMIENRMKEVRLIISKKSAETARRMELDELEQEVVTQLQKGKVKNAIQSLTRIVAIRRAVLKTLDSSGQDAYQAQHDMGRSLHQLGSLLAKKGDFVNSQRAYTDALTMFEKVGDVDSCKLLRSEQDKFKYLSC